MSFNLFSMRVLVYSDRYMYKESCPDFHILIGSFHSLVDQLHEMELTNLFCRIVSCEVEHWALTLKHIS